MSLKTITKKVVSFSEIPSEITRHHWINQIDDVERVEVHIDDEEPDELITYESQSLMIEYNCKL